ncbi:MAG: hypothetical protein C0170_03610 [Hydrogenobaculum sp.]|nr:MAG: hypothetical protein C0170_03610 [Hydrogenobaculum sp.]
MNYAIVRSNILEEITLTYQSFLEDILGYDKKQSFSYMEDLLFFIEEQILDNLFNATIIEDELYKQVLTLPNNIKIIGLFSKIEVRYRINIHLSQIELISYKLSR